MSTAESFCYVALLKNPKTLAAQLALLTDSRRSQIESVMKDLRALSDAGLRMQWQRLRHEEAEVKKLDCLQRYGTGFRAFSPCLQKWLCQALWGLK